MASFFEGEQAVTLLGVLCKGGEATGKLKMVKMKLAIAMTSDTIASAPDWASEAYAFILKSHDTVRPAHEFEAMSLSFSADQLFGHKVVQGAAVSLKGFEIAEDGAGEDADVAVTFTAEVAFADGLWRWLGQMQGKDFYAKFEQVVEAPKPAAEATGQMSLSVN
jgi:hypothetical protein